MTLLWYLRGYISNLPRASRMALGCACATLVLVSIYGRGRIRDVPSDIIKHHIVKQPGGAYRIPKGNSPSVNLVVAATSKEDYSWVKDLRVPGMDVIPYIADNTSAPYHAQQNKGHEAMMYHQYFFDFYENLPDISILIHSQQQSWHVEELLDQSMIFSLNHLDLREVMSRQFLNLRVTWGIGCSTGSINTTRVNEESGSQPEQKEMQEAFRANFNIYDVPEILATPCCSQIAVTKERILSVPREQYQHHIDWLLRTDLPDSISGRTWEHMWQHLFLQKAIDCPIEHKVYCRLYHICFGGREEYDEWIELHQGRQNLEKELRNLVEAEEKELSFEHEDKKDKRDKREESKDGEKGRQDERKKSGAKEIVKANTRKWLEDELASVREAIRVRREVAVVRGAIEVNRVAEGDSLYGDDFEPGIEKIILKPSATLTSSRSV